MINFDYSSKAKEPSLSTSQTRDPAHTGKTPRSPLTPCLPRTTMCSQQLLSPLISAQASSSKTTFSTTSMTSHSTVTTQQVVSTSTNPRPLPYPCNTNSPPPPQRPNNQNGHSNNNSLNNNPKFKCKNQVINRTTGLCKKLTRASTSRIKTICIKRTQTNRSHG